VIAMGNLRFNETRIGAHVTAFKLGKLNIGISGGYLHESEWGRGAYGVAEFNFKV
jgi:hypothetical protein